MRICLLINLFHLHPQVVYLAPSPLAYHAVIAKSNATVANRNV